MNILIGFLIVLQVIVSLLLILIILVQPSKSGGGLGGAAFGGGGMGEQLFGARAGNVLTKGTVLFAVIFMVNTLALAFLYAKSSGLSAAPRDLQPPTETAMGGVPDAPPEIPAELAEIEEEVGLEEEADVIEQEDLDQPVEGTEAEILEEDEIPLEDL